MNSITAIFIGRSGSGKGTQAKLLREYLSKETPEIEVLYNETGKLFREFITGDKYTNHLVDEILEKSGRGPDFLAISLWGNNLVYNMKENMHLLIDGTPRSLMEAKILDGALSFYKRHAFVLNIEISREEAIRRLKARGREDDKKIEDIENRLNWFDQDVAPAIDHYKENKNYTYLEINGEQDVDSVHKDILSKLK